MNQLTIILATILVLALSVTSSFAGLIEPRCAPHEVYDACGSACPEHCPSPNPQTGKLETKARYCNKVCVRGCFCSGSLVRDLKRGNTCVEKSTCTLP